MSEDSERGLFRKFGHQVYGGRSIVNYENLVNYLVRTRIDARKAARVSSSQQAPALAGL